MDGIRDSKTVNGVTHEYITQGGNVALERWKDTTGSHSLEFIYDNSGAPYSVIYDGVTYYYILNQQGDVVRIVDSTGATKAEYTYDAWGKILNVSNATGSDIGAVNPLRYRGYYYDTELGMYYVQSRYYDPVVKRMICADDESIVAGSTLNNNNLFAYCDNNPVNRADRGGDIWNIVAGAVVGAVSGVAATALGAFISGEQISAKEIALSAISGAVAGGICAIPGLGSGAQAIVNGVVNGVAEVINQTRIQKETNGKVIVENVAMTVIGSAADSFLGGAEKMNKKAAKEYIGHCKGMIKNACETLKSRKGAAKKFVSKLKTSVKTSGILKKKSFLNGIKSTRQSLVKSLYFYGTIWAIKRHQKRLRK